MPKEFQTHNRMKHAFVDIAGCIVFHRSISGYFVQDVSLMLKGRSAEVRNTPPVCD